MASSLASYVGWSISRLFCRRRDSQSADDSQHAPDAQPSHSPVPAPGPAPDTPIALDSPEDGRRTVQLHSSSRPPQPFPSDTHLEPSTSAPEEDPLPSSRRPTARSNHSEPTHPRAPSTVSTAFSRSHSHPPAEDSCISLSRVRLDVHEAGNHGVRIFLDASTCSTRLTCGRGVTSDIAVPFPDVSVRHCSIFISTAEQAAQLQLKHASGAHSRTASNVLDGVSDAQRHEPPVRAFQSKASSDSRSRCWYAADIGSLNGTCINNEPLERDGRRRSAPRALKSDDVLRLGERPGSHEVKLHEMIVPSLLKQHQEQQYERSGGGGSPVGPAAAMVQAEWAAANSPSPLRSNGSEDVYVLQGPLEGAEYCFLFAVLDGHNGAEAAKEAARCLPKHVSEAVQREQRHGGAWSLRALSSAFNHVDKDVKSLNTGSTLTAMLTWREGNEMLIRCANIGDSDCAVGIPDGSSMGMQTSVLSTSHKVSDKTESQRLEHEGQSTNPSGSRVYGLNLSRVLGDKTLKAHCPAIIADPSVSEVFRVSEEGGVVVLATDGVWDMISSRRALAVCSVSARVERMAHHIVRSALSAGTHDDATAVVVRLSPRLPTAAVPLTSSIR